MPALPNLPPGSLVNTASTVDLPNTQAIEQLQQRLTHRFRNRDLLLCALTHPSYVAVHPEVTDSNQRLEYLGDTILQMVLTEALFHRFPEEREGPLSRRRSLLTRGTRLADIARDIGVPDALLMGGGEDTPQGRQRTAALEDAFEALMGALYLDSDLDTARRILLHLFGDLAEATAPVEGGSTAAGNPEDPYAEHENPKGLLQERIQPVLGNNALRYELLSTTGEDHNRSYEAGVFLIDRQLGSGSGSSKKNAEIAAARQALATLDREGLPNT